MVSGCSNGDGGEGFYNWFRQSVLPETVANKIIAMLPKDTLSDQRETQKLARALLKCRTAILISRRVRLAASETCT